MRLSDVHVAGIGTAACDYVQTADAVDRGWYSAEQRDRSGMIAVAVAGTVAAPDLAVEAAGRAVTASGLAPAEFGAVLHSNVHPQGPEGWSAQHYINRNTINQPVTSMEVRNGCVGFFSSLHLASCFLGVHPEAEAVLMTCADNVGTPAVDRWSMSNAFIAADGGGAVVLSRRPGFARVLAVGSACNPELERRHRGGGPLFPPPLTRGEPMNFEERFEYAKRKAEEGVLPPLGDFRLVVAEAAKTVLAEADTSPDEISRVVHDGFNQDSVNVFFDPVGIEPERGMWEFTRRHGHAGPLDAIRGLEHLWVNGEVGIGDRVLLVS
ncbi:MAG: ketoacyl-ACP synthase III family protein, partial [Pseudonocardia sp.]